MRRIACGLVVLAGLIGGVGDAAAQHRCRTDRGKEIDTDNGATTANLTGWVTCVFADDGGIRKTRYARGQVVAEQDFFRKGRPREVRQFWYSREGNRRNHGKWKRWYKNGQLEEVTVYVRGKEQGAYVRYLEDGSLREEGYYQAGEKLGVTLYNRDGSVDHISCSKQPATARHELYGRLCGFTDDAPVTFYHAKGKRKRVQWFRRGEVIALEEYDRAGTLVESDDRARKNKRGIKVSRHANGRTKQETRYDTRGVLEGAQREFDKSGQITRDALFENGFMVGETLYWLNGQQKRVTRKQKVDDDTVLLSSTQYHDTGKVASTGQYLERTRVVAFGYGDYWNYEALTPIGEHRSYREDGSPESIEYYDDGELRRRKVLDNAGRLIADDEFFADGSRKRHAVRR